MIDRELVLLLRGGAQPHSFVGDRVYRLLYYQSARVGVHHAVCRVGGGSTGHAASRPSGLRYSTQGLNSSTPKGSKSSTFRVARVRSY